MTLHVVRAGLYTTVQDLGRFGHQSRGIGQGGAMDALAVRLANALVGNTPGTAALELTLTGPTLRFAVDTLIAVTGAALAPAVDGQPIPERHAVLVRAGHELSFGGGGAGCRAYLAVAGGIDVPLVLGSRSTNVRGGFGGHDGRPLRAGDTLPVGAPSADARQLMRRLVARAGAWTADRAQLATALTAAYLQAPALRLLLGAEHDRLTEASQVALFAETFRVGAQSDRMGYRLEGPTLALTAPMEMTSEGVAWGTVQLPPDGHPIVLLADRQTTGGYPVIGHVITADLPAAAQLRPGDRFRFTATTLDQAQQLQQDRERAVALAIQALHVLRSAG